MDIHLPLAAPTARVIAAGTRTRPAPPRPPEDGGGPPRARCDGATAAGRRWSCCLCSARLRRVRAVAFALAPPRRPAPLVRPPTKRSRPIATRGRAQGPKGHQMRSCLPPCSCWLARDRERDRAARRGSAVRRQRGVRGTRSGFSSWDPRLDFG